MLKKKPLLYFMSVVLTFGFIISLIFLLYILKTKTNKGNNLDIGRLSQIDSTQPIYGNGLTAAEEQFKKTLVNKYQNQIPTQWGENIPGVITKINTGNKLLALTFDACGGVNGSGYDKELIDFLIKENIPATLFINARWIDANQNTFMDLAKNPLFEIENHGLLHKPLSVNGKSIYDIKGTMNVSEIVDEILINERKIESLIHRKPKYFRSGTAYYDEIAVKIVNEIGEKAINYNVLGDAGATYSKEQVEKACLDATPGSIIILHMNHPEKFTAEGIIAAVPQLKKLGFSFVKLNDYDSSLFAISPPSITSKDINKDYFYHTVISGDNLWGISTKYSVTIDDIKLLNSLSSTIISINTKLKIPVKDYSKLIPPVDIYHIVEKGETLWMLNNIYKSYLNDIFAKNNLNQNSILKIGQIIVIPVKSRI